MAESPIELAMFF